MSLLEKTYYTKPEQDSHVGYGQWRESAKLTEDASMDKPEVSCGGQALIGNLISIGATALAEENTVVMEKSPYHDAPAKGLSKEDFTSREMWIRFSDGFLYIERISVNSEIGLFTVTQRWSEENKKTITEHAKREHWLAIRMQRQGLGKPYGFFEGLAEQRKAEKNPFNDRGSNTTAYTTQIFQVKDPIQSSEESDGVKTMQSNNVSGKTEIVFTDKKKNIKLL